jgi:hypothetical protein
MDEAIRRFYEVHQIPLERQISTRPSGLTPGQIEAAAEFIYRNRDGIEPIMLVREVRRVAKEIDASKYREVDHVREAALAISDAKASVEDFQIEVKKFEDEVERVSALMRGMKGILQGHLNRVENATWSNRILMIIIVLMLIGVLVGVWKGEWGN